MIGASVVVDLSGVVLRRLRVVRKLNLLVGGLAVVMTGVIGVVFTTVVEGLVEDRILDGFSDDDRRLGISLILGTSLSFRTVILPSFSSTTGLLRTVCPLLALAVVLNRNLFVKVLDLGVGGTAGPLAEVERPIWVGLCRGTCCVVTTFEFPEALLCASLSARDIPPVGLSIPRLVGSDTWRDSRGGLV